MTPIKDWLISIALKKGVSRGVMAIVSYMASEQAQSVLANYGITINNAKFSEAVNLLAIGFFMAVLEFVRNWAKKKKGINLI